MLLNKCVPNIPTLAQTFHIIWSYRILTVSTFSNKYVLMAPKALSVTGAWCYFSHKEETLRQYWFSDYYKNSSQCVLLLCLSCVGLLPEINCGYLIVLVGLVL